jgi:hypothetical protein
MQSLMDGWMRGGTTAIATCATVMKAKSRRLLRESRTF